MTIEVLFWFRDMLGYTTKNISTVRNYFISGLMKCGYKFSLFSCWSQIISVTLTSTSIHSLVQKLNCLLKPGLKETKNIRQATVRTRKLWN